VITLKVKKGILSDRNRKQLKSKDGSKLGCYSSKHVRNYQNYVESNQQKAMKQFDETEKSKKL